jgi:GPH family glycoside/pentoside/hexuronide:cation symporter
METTFKKSIKYFWGVGDIGVGFINVIFNLFFAFFLTDVAMLPLSYVSFILIFVSIAEIFISLVSGILVEGMKTLKWGRYRSWLFICPLGNLLVFPFLFLTIGSYFENTLIIALAVLLHITLINIALLSNYALIPVISKKRNDRIVLASNRMVGMQIGNLVFGSLAPFLLNTVFLDYFGKWAYAIIAIIASLFFLIGYWVHFNLSKGAETATFNRIDNSDRITLRQMLSAIFKTPSLIPAILADSASTCCTFVLPAIAIYYYNYVIEQPALLVIHMLVVGACAVTGSFCSRFMLRKFHVKTACLIIYPIIAVLLFSTQFVAYIPWAFIALNGIVLFFAGMTQPMETHFYLDSIIYSEWKTKVSAKAVIMSLTSLSPTLSKLMKGIIISVTLVSVDYQAGSTSQAVKDGIITAYSVVPVMILLVGWLVLFFFYKLTPDQVEMMRKEIEERKINDGTEDYKAHWEKRYEESDTIPWDVEQPEPWIVELAEQGKISGTILDAGCGPGRNTLWLASAGFNVIGADISSLAINRAKQKASVQQSRANFLCTNLQTFSEYGNYFDTIIDIGCYHSPCEASARRKYVENLWRMCKSNAVVYIRAFRTMRLDDGTSINGCSEEQIRNDFANPDWEICDMQCRKVDLLTFAGTADAWFVVIKKN